LIPEGGSWDWPFEGPFWGFRISRDAGKTWEETPNRPYSLENRGSLCKAALFPEPAYYHGPVKFGAPHVVDFGCNMEHSPDGKVYLVAHGCEDDSPGRFVKTGWNHGDGVYMARVKPGVETINNRSAYEFFSGRDLNGKAHRRSQPELELRRK